MRHDQRRASTKQTCAPTFNAAAEAPYVVTEVAKRWLSEATCDMSLLASSPDTAKCAHCHDQGLRDIAAILSKLDIASSEMNRSLFWLRIAIAGAIGRAVPAEHGAIGSFEPSGSLYTKIVTLCADQNRLRSMLRSALLKRDALQAMNVRQRRRGR